MSPKIRSAAAAAVTLASVVCLAPKANGSDPRGGASVSDRVVQVIDARSFGGEPFASRSRFEKAKVDAKAAGLTWVTSYEGE